MKAFNLYIDKYDWLLRTYIDVSKHNSREIVDYMYGIGCSSEDAYIAQRNLCNEANNGLCYSNMRERISVIVLGNTTSAKEFLDSLVHEVMHLAIHIATEDGLDLRSEEVCYIGGDIAKELYPYCKNELCCKCH